MAKKKPSKKKAVKKAAKKRTAKKAAPKRKAAKKKAPKKVAKTVRKKRPASKPRIKHFPDPPVVLNPHEVQELLNQLSKISTGTPDRAALEALLTNATARQSPNQITQSYFTVVLNHADNMDSSNADVQVTRIEPK